MRPSDTRISRRLRRGAAAAFAAVAVVGALLIGGAPQPVAAAAGDVVIQPGQLAVTFVALSCPEYTDIMANRARNNIQESLRELGKDTVYSAGQPISPTIEGPNQPNCTPLRNWDFQLGTGYTGKTPATQYLSTVTGGYATPIRTGGPIPELDASGVDTGRTIDGAVTIVLDAAQAQQAQRPNSLWAQGGRGAQTLPATGEFGFGALRCAVDNLNGDNVEFISYPTASRHVFCYYFAVTPPPEAGTIIVRKQVTPGTVGGSAFPFEGNISYDKPTEGAPGRFTLNASDGSTGSITFIRGAVGPGDPLWNFRELMPAGWVQAAVPVCTSVLGSPWSFDPGTGISVELLADDVVTCTFVNERDLTGPAFLYKLAVNGTGSFPFRVTPPLQPEVSTTVDVTTPYTFVEVLSTPGNVAGEYVTTETLPIVSYGTWELIHVLCEVETGGVEGPIEDLPFTSSGQDRTASRTIASGESLVCVFVNAFDSDGRIDVEKTTLGGVGTFTYGIVPVDEGNPSQFGLSATTTAPGVTVDALPVPPSGAAENLPIGSRWTVQEFLPAPTQEGYWRVVEADCGGAVRGVDLPSATVTVEITEEAPEVQCSFVNEFVSLSSFQVIKNTSSDTALRPDPAVISWACSNRTGGDVSVPSAQATADDTVDVVGYTTCTVVETATGAASGVSVDTSAVLTFNGVDSAYTLGDPIVVEPEDDVVVTVDNVLAVIPPTPTPTPTPTTTVGPMPPTGLDAAGLTPIAVAGALAVALGAALLSWSAYRRRVR